VNGRIGARSTIFAALSTIFVIDENVYISQRRSQLNKFVRIPPSAENSGGGFYLQLERPLIASNNIVVDEAFVLRVPQGANLAETAPLLCASIVPA
jgi:hypothetical protein